MHTVESCVSGDSLPWSTAQIYAVEPVSTDNTLIVHVSDLYRLFQLRRNDSKKIKYVGLQDCKMCMKHGVTLSRATIESLVYMEPRQSNGSGAALLNPSKVRYRKLIESPVEKFLISTNGWYLQVNRPIKREKFDDDDDDVDANGKSDDAEESKTSMSPLIDDGRVDLEFLINEANETFKCNSDQRGEPASVLTLDEYKSGGWMSGVVADDECCVEAPLFNSAFGVNVAGKTYMFPLPKMYSAKNFSFFRSIVELCHQLHRALCFNAPLPDKIKMIASSAMNRVELTNHVHKYIDKTLKKFLQNDFKCSNFSILQSGKRSYVRSYLLGHRHNGARMTMVVDNELGPNSISIPYDIYSNLDLASNLVIINRDPSINDTCIYVCEMFYHNTDPCIHLNPFVLDGLHADQDGDDISINYLKYERAVSSPQMKMAITELRALSWNYGYRHNLFYKPRYTLGQQFRHLLYTHDEWFVKNSPLYRTLTKVHKGNLLQKIDSLMHLGCSVMRNEINDFIETVLAFNCKNIDNCLHGQDFIKCDDEIIEVVNSKSKGSHRHIELYKYNLLTPSDGDALKSAFDDKIESSKTLEREGQTQFSLMHALTPVSLLLGDLYMGDKVVLKHYTDTALMDVYKYNLESVKFVFKLVLMNAEEFAVKWCNYTVHDNEEAEADVTLMERFTRAMMMINSKAAEKQPVHNMNIDTQSVATPDANFNNEYKTFRELTKKQLYALYTSKNPFLEGVDKTPIGLNYSIMLQSQKIQTALNVKRLKEVKEAALFKKGTMSPITPSICIKWLFSPKTYNWYRVSLDDIANVEKVAAAFTDCVGYAILHKTVVEYYFPLGSVKTVLAQLEQVHDNEHVVRVIFAANCRAVLELYHKHVMQANEMCDNLTNFLYCYYTNSLCVDHSKPEYILMYNFVAIMFLINRNLNNPTNSTIKLPLHAISGEFPQRVLANLIKDKTGGSSSGAGQKRTVGSVYPVTTNRERRMFKELCDVFSGTSSELVVDVYRTHQHRGGGDASMVKRRKF